MKTYATENIRNIVLVGHGGAGKTTLAEALLFLSGATTRMGKVTDGNTVCDFDEEEIRKGISVSTALAPIEWGDCKINILDAPATPTSSVRCAPRCASRISQCSSCLPSKVSRCRRRPHGVTRTSSGCLG